LLGTNYTQERRKARGAAWVKEESSIADQTKKLKNRRRNFPRS